MIPAGKSKIAANLVLFYLRYDRESLDTFIHYVAGIGTQTEYNFLRDTIAKVIERETA